MINRVLIRLGDEVNIDQLYIDESIETVSDRLNLRLGTVTVPTQFQSIVVDAVVKMYRRQYYEGIQNEQIDTISLTFVDNILDEYQREIEAYLDSNRKVRFL